MVPRKLMLSELSCPWILASEQDEPAQAHSQEAARMFCPPPLQMVQALSWFFWQGCRGAMVQVAKVCMLGSCFRLRGVGFSVWGLVFRDLTSQFKPPTVNPSPNIVNLKNSSRNTKPYINPKPSTGKPKGVAPGGTSCAAGACQGRKKWGLHTHICGLLLRNFV